MERIEHCFDDVSRALAEADDIVPCEIMTARRRPDRVRARTEHRGRTQPYRYVMSRRPDRRDRPVASAIHGTSATRRCADMDRVRLFDSLYGGIIRRQDRERDGRAFRHTVSGHDIQA